eukprot:2108254-Prymnesium_polylepis.1
MAISGEDRELCNFDFPIKADVRQGGLDERPHRGVHLSIRLGPERRLSRQRLATWRLRPRTVPRQLHPDTLWYER